MDKILWVGAGGCVGAMLRYLVGDATQHIAKSMALSTAFPWGTFTVNMIGCFVIGLLMQLADMRSILTGETRALLITGLLGSFTTFSTFGNDTFCLLRDGKTFVALGNVGVHVVCGLTAVWLGYALAAFVWR